MSSSQNPIFTGLIASATADGILSQHSANLITGNLGRLVIAGAAGKALEDIVATDVTLITVLIDSSSSIADRGLAHIPGTEARMRPNIGR